MSGAEGSLDTNKTTEVVNTTNILDNLQKTIANGKLNNLQDNIISQENKENIQKQATESMKKVGDMFKLDVPFLGEIGSLFGTKWPIDLLGTKEERSKNKVLNGILKIFGFKNGMEEVHQLYIQDQIKGIDKALATDCYKAFKNIEKTDISDDQKTRTICGLDKIFASMKDEDKTALQNKIPQDFEGLKTSLIQALPNHINKLNISTVNMIGEPFIGVDTNNKKIIKTEEIQKNISGFVDSYLKLTIPQLANSENDFITSNTNTSDSFAFALFGNLTGEKFFVEAVNLGLEKVPPTTINNPVAQTKEQVDNEADLDQVGKIKTELDSVKNCPLTPEMIIKASKDHNVPISYVMAIMKNDSSYGTAGKGARTHNPGNVGNTDDGSTKDRGTREAGVDAVAKNIARRIEEYQKIYGNKVPTIKELAQNKGPDGKGFLPNQGNYKKLNTNFTGAYMTSRAGQERVEDIALNLTQKGISDERIAA